MTLNARFFRLLTENELFSGVSPELLRAVLTESQVRFIRFAREETIVCALDGRPALGFLLRGELLHVGLVVLQKVIHELLVWLNWTFTKVKVDFKRKRRFCVRGYR